MIQVNDFNFDENKIQIFGRPSALRTKDRRKLEAQIAKPVTKPIAKMRHEDADFSKTVAVIVSNDKTFTPPYSEIGIITKKDLDKIKKRRLSENGIYVHQHDFKNMNLTGETLGGNKTFRKLPL